MRKIWYFVPLILLLACQKKIEIKGFNHSQWLEDPYACKGQRVALAKYIIDHKKSFLSLDDDDIVALLGRPERSYYYERNVRAFGYYINGAPKCSTSTLNNNPQIITIEFNATGFSKRIYYQSE
jgi:hypothetical protein